jgi:NADH:ubiquinone oxidoreductase subunit 5 (subunit L)/multisubunit Na+/H+ antiporter MnhA subunit
MEALYVILGLATLAPFAAFWVILCVGGSLGRKPIVGGWIALSAIGLAAALSFVAAGIWWLSEPPSVAGHAAAEHATAATAEDDHGGHALEPNPAPVARTGVYYTLGRFGNLEINISYYIDSLTIVMFCMVTFIATCIHIYALGYMHDEEHEVTDHEVTLANGEHLTRPGRFPRFFQYMSLFCFSMLGLVLSGNIAMVFVFWELVGICSYFLIGFYIERKSASTAANKAFIVNRVGDFGFIIGLMALWGSLGTFAFGDLTSKTEDGQTLTQPGIFSQLRTEENHYALQPSDSMVTSAARDEMHDLMRSLGPGSDPSQVASAAAEKVSEWREQRGWLGARYGYWLLIIAGVGIFCGCVGKSAQFPLHVWLPDAMEGPTPVSALVHSATMVAAGVYLVGRFYPVFTPEVLWVIATTGCITLFMAATIAITATDIKRVLAYSTVSQLGYMMLALGVGGWLAGMMHLITHAFFKSLLFLCSGSVIHAVHTNEMTEMGGLRKKMPITAATMLVGCLAIAGAGVPFLVGFSGYYSKDMILEQAFSFLQANGPGWGLIFFGFAAGGAAITAFYMFRMWYMTFAGEPRDHHRYDHAHESPTVMWGPLVVLAALAIAVAWPPEHSLRFAALAAVAWLVWVLRSGLSGNQGPVLLRAGVAIIVLAVAASIWPHSLTLSALLEQSRPLGTLPTVHGGDVLHMTWPAEPLSHDFAVPITLLAFGTAVGGFLLATAMYGLGWMSPDEVRRQFAGMYRFLRNKWWFDELYAWLLVKPAHVVAQLAARMDRRVIDGMVDGLATVTRWFSRRWDAIADRTIVDGLANLSANWTYTIGLSLRGMQTGRLRQYVMFIVVGTIAIFILISFFWNPSLAG